MMLASNCLYGFVAEGDTLIIDGKTVNVQVKEGEEEAYEDSEPLDSLDNLVFRTKLFSGGYERGFSFNKIESSGLTPWLDKFVGNERIPGSYQSFSLGVLAENQKNIWFGVQLSIDNWNLKHSLYTGDFTDDFWSFESPEKGELNQVNVEFTQIGAEFDTLGVELATGKYRENFISIGTQIGTEFLKNENGKKSQLIGLIGAGFHAHLSSFGDNFHYVSESTWFEASADPFTTNDFRVSASAELMLLSNITSKLSVNPSVKYSYWFTPTFDSATRINYTRSGLGIGLRISYKF